MPYTRPIARACLAASLTVAGWSAADAQSLPPSRNGYFNFVVSSCGTAGFSALLGSYAPTTVDVNGNSCSASTSSGGAVYGPDAQGNAPTKPPVLLGLLDGSNNVRALGPSNPLSATLLAGSAKIGVVTTDQTTHGTTDKVAADAYIGGAAMAPGNPGFVAEVGSSVAAAGITPVVVQSGTSAVGKASAGNLYSVQATNLSTTSGYLACVNSASAPASGAAITPVDVAVLPGSLGGTAAVDYKAGPPNAYGTGITCLATTSLTTYTPGGNALILVRVR